MSAHNKTLWSEGLFLRPQHFQQHERYLERYVETRCQSLTSDSWGLAEVELERDLLGIGKLAIRRAVGVFPDGTPFRMPDDDPLPAALEIDASTRDQVVYLSVPLRRPGVPDVVRGSAIDGLERHSPGVVDAWDATLAGGSTTPVEVGRLRTHLLLAGPASAAYAMIPVAHVVECRADRSVVLEESFIPTVIQVRAANRLRTFTTELVAMVHQRGDALAARVGSTGRGGAAEIADFLMLQVINRFEPVLAHMSATGRLHPEVLYRTLVALAGELATFTTVSKRPPALGEYRHDHLRESFELVMTALRTSLSAVLEQAAVPIALEQRKYGIRVAAPADRTLYKSAVFVLAARADMASEELRRQFPSQVKIGPVEKIAELVNVQLAGVPLSPLPAAPRQIPQHAGFVYFEFDQSHALWTRLESSGGLAMHVAGEFSNLSLELWAIRG